MNNLLTKEQINEFKEAFDCFDKNGNGKITQQEFVQVMRSLGQNPSETETQVLMNDVKAFDGIIDYDQFLKVMEQKMNEDEHPEEEEFIEICKVFDKQGNGMISVDQLRQILSNLGEKLTNVEIEEMINEACIDNNGFINYEEFLGMMASK